MFSRTARRILPRVLPRVGVRQFAQEASNNIPLIGGGVLLLAGGAGAYYMFQSGSSSSSTPKTSSGSGSGGNTYVDNWKSSMERCIARRILAVKSEDEIKELRGRTTKHGWNLDKLTICGTKHGHRKAGVYCGDAETYELFADILDPLVSEFHGINLGKDLQSRETYAPAKIDTLPDNVEILSTRIRCARSVSPYPMTVNMSKEQRVEFETMMEGIFSEFTGQLKGKYWGHTSTPKERLDQLVGEHKLFCDDDECLRDGGCYTDWPHGRGIFMNDAETFMVWVGEEDHLRIMSLQKGANVQNVWNLFYKGVEAVDRGLQKRGKSFAFDPKYGHVNCCPSNLGTGMRASVHVNLPKYKTKAAVAEAINNSSLKGRIQARGTHGEAKNTDGVTIYDISNYTRLGNCPSLIKDMIDGVIMLSK